MLEKFFGFKGDPYYGFNSHDITMAIILGFMGGISVMALIILIGWLTIG